MDERSKAPARDSKCKNGTFLQSQTDQSVDSLKVQHMVRRLSVLQREMVKSAGDSFYTAVELIEPCYFLNTFVPFCFYSRSTNDNMVSSSVPEEGRPPVEVYQTKCVRFRKVSKSIMNQENLLPPA